MGQPVQNVKKVEFHPLKVRDFRYVFQLYQDDKPQPCFIAWIDIGNPRYPQFENRKICTVEGAHAAEMTPGHCETYEVCQAQCNWINERIKNGTLG